MYSPQQQVGLYILFSIEFHQFIIGTLNSKQIIERWNSILWSELKSTYWGDTWKALKNLLWIKKL